MNQNLRKDTLILTAEKIQQKIRRIAFEVYEQNFQEKQIFLAGIEGTGYELAGLLAEELRKIAPLEVKLVKINVEKAAPTQAEVMLDCPSGEFEGQIVIIIDDVLKTGRTLAYCLRPFLKVHIRKLQMAVLVDRSHRLFPVSADFTGYELSTTVNEHVEVILEGAKAGVYLY